MVIFLGSLQQVGRLGGLVFASSDAFPLVSGLITTLTLTKLASGTPRMLTDFEGYGSPLLAIPPCFLRSPAPCFCHDSSVTRILSSTERHVMDSKEKATAGFLAEMHVNLSEGHDEPQIPTVDPISSFRLEKTQRMLKVSKRSSEQLLYVWILCLEPAYSTHRDWR